MRKQIAFSLALLSIATVSLLIVAAPFGSAHSDHKDLTINRTLTKFTSGPFVGDLVTFYGSGTWDTATGAVQAGGMLIHRHPNGRLVARAPWKATGVESFDSFGTAGDGLLEGGELVLDVTVFGPGGVVKIGDFTITCLLGDNVPAGAEEGVEAPSIGLTETVEAPHRFTLFENI